MTKLPVPRRCGPAPSQRAMLTLMFDNMLGSLSADSLETAEALRTWVFGGLYLFPTSELPTLQEVTAQARLILIVRAMRTNDNVITYVANQIGCSRRHVRDYLHQYGLYPNKSKRKSRRPVDKRVKQSRNRSSRKPKSD